MSLVLWQAIMFAGTAFVDIIHLELEGFTTHKGARRAYYEKVRVFQPDFSDQTVLLGPVLTRGLHSSSSMRTLNLNQLYSFRSFFY